MNMQAIEAKAKKVPKQTQDFKAALEGLQELLASAAEELASKAESAAHQAETAADTAPSDAMDASSSSVEGASAATDCAALSRESTADGPRPDAEAGAAVSAAAGETDVSEAAAAPENGVADAVGNSGTVDVSDVERQMLSLAVTTAAAAAEPSNSLHAAPVSLQPFQQTLDPATNSDILPSSTQQHQQAADMSLHAAMQSPPQQQQQQASGSRSQEDGLLGPDLPHGSTTHDDLPATQLQDSEALLTADADPLAGPEASQGIASTPAGRPGDCETILDSESDAGEDGDIRYSAQEGSGRVSTSSEWVDNASGLTLAGGLMSNDQLPATQPFPNSEVQSGKFLEKAQCAQPCCRSNKTISSSDSPIMHSRRTGL